MLYSKDQSKCSSSRRHQKVIPDHLLSNAYLRMWEWQILRNSQKSIFTSCEQKTLLSIAAGGNKLGWPIFNQWSWTDILVDIDGKPCYHSEHNHQIQVPRWPWQALDRLSFLGSKRKTTVTNIQTNEPVVDDREPFVVLIISQHRTHSPQLLQYQIYLLNSVYWSLQLKSLG